MLFPTQDAKVTIDPEGKCKSCGVSRSYVEQGRREYVIPWGEYLLCDKCHRFTIMEGMKTEMKALFESN